MNTKTINTYTAINKSEIKHLWKEITNLHSRHLKQYDIKLPNFGTCKSLQLIYLYKYQGCFVNKDVVSEFIAKNKKLLSDKNAQKDQQIRHLGSQLGYNITVKGEEANGEITPSGYHMLINLTEPKAQFLKEYNKRKSILSSKSFEDIKEHYGHCCATCGAKEGSLHKVTGKVVKLTQGHMDPSKELTPSNTIPQCEYCNQNAYKNDFIFDSNGYIKEIYNPQVILKASPDVKAEMLRLLLAEQGSDSNG